MLWGSGFTGVSADIGAIAKSFHCCCKEQQQLSLLDSPRSLRRCDHAQPGQNLNLSDPRSRTLQPRSVTTNKVELGKK